ncbi:MAG: nuclear transport factor 2 family protein [Nitrospinaceae bacterium]|nr:MAG: nuclear transport factor 2 family protein [Nitrospinaceae bacterium]
MNPEEGVGAGEVKEANERFYRAFNERDLELMDRVWHRDGEDGVEVVCIHPGWEPLRGFEAIQKSWSNIFKNSENMNIRISHLGIGVSGELAWVHCRENLFVIQPTGVQTSYVHATNLFRREDRAWKMILHHASSIPFGGEGSPPD